MDVKTVTEAGEDVAVRARELLAELLVHQGCSEAAQHIRDGSRSLAGITVSHADLAAASLRAIAPALTVRPVVRDEVIEECARVAVKIMQRGGYPPEANEVAAAIRALATPVDGGEMG